jgi:hypothetical protein
MNLYWLDRASNHLCPNFEIPGETHSTSSPLPVEDCLMLEYFKLHAVYRFVLDWMDIVLFSYLRVSYAFPFLCFKCPYLRHLTMTSSC